MDRLRPDDLLLTQRKQFREGILLLLLRRDYGERAFHFWAFWALENISFDILHLSLFASLTSNIDFLSVPSFLLHKRLRSISESLGSSPLSL